MQRELHPRPRKQPAPSISDAILLMKKRDELARKLPGLNCCACGSPSCLTFAEDVVVHGTDIEACPYLDDSLKKK
jgi:ArsR family metal-binding transcriptional regulator